MEKRISGTTTLLALIGSPVGHSGSPAMHNYSFEKLGLDYLDLYLIHQPMGDYYGAYRAMEEEYKKGKKSK